jgi:hypothetical protein
MKKVLTVILVVVGILWARSHLREHVARSAQETKNEASFPDNFSAENTAPAGGQPLKIGSSNAVNAEIIRRAKAVSASGIDPLLPDQPLGNWLNSTLGQISWETNDCGKQNGAGPQDRVPVCANAETRLPDGLQLSIWIAVGSKGLQEPGGAPDFSGKPALKWLGLSSGDHLFDCQLRLADVPELVKMSSMSPTNVEEWCSGRLQLH